MRQITMRADHYEGRLLSVTNNRIDRYVSICHKNYTLMKRKWSNLLSDQHYIVDTHKWACTCSVRKTGFPSREPCKHQHAVANKYTLNSPAGTCSNSTRRGRTGRQSFYANLQEGMAVENSVSVSADVLQSMSYRLC